MANQFKLKAYGHVKIRIVTAREGEIFLKGRVGSSSKISRDMVTRSLIGNLSREEFEGLEDKAEFERDVSVRHPPFVGMRRKKKK